MQIAIVIPTIRPDSYKKFREDWNPLFKKHNVHVITVWDGEKPYVDSGAKYSLKNIMGEYSDLIYNFNGGVRNLGFAFVAKRLKYVEYIITLDDDLEPEGDTIQDHVDALNMMVPVSWFSTASSYMRGFPYRVREEAEVVLSHGVWKGNPDWDAPTQLVNGKQMVYYPRCPVPKGIYYPMCSMNLAFKRKVLPFIYHAPSAFGVNRANDIFAGIVSKREIDKKGWAVVTGYSMVNHTRASNVYENLKKEAVEIGYNETFWTGELQNDYTKLYEEKYKRWKEFIND